jgi:hypothetical protein
MRHTKGVPRSPAHPWSSPPEGPSACRCRKHGWRSCRPVVLMDEPTEPVTPDDRHGAIGQWIAHAPARRLLSERSVRSTVVVVSRCSLSTACKCRVPKMSRWSGHSLRRVPTARSQIAFARGARTGLRVTSMPSDRNTSSKALVNLVSRSRMRNRKPENRSASSRARWVTPRAGRLCRDPTEMDPEGHRYSAPSAPGPRHVERRCKPERLEPDRDGVPRFQTGSVHMLLDRATGGGLQAALR